MSVMLTRFFTYFTLVAYLVVGTVIVRFCLPETATVSFTTSYLNLVADAPLEVAQIEPIAAPEMYFAEIKIPVEKIIVKKALPKVAAVLVAPTATKAPEMAMRVLESNELPFYEPVTLQKVYLNQTLTSDFLVSYKDFSFSETAIADTHTVSDEVSTNLASAENVEPEFFEYPTEELKKVETQKIAKKEVIEESSEIETQDISDLVEAKEVAVEETVANDSVKEPEFFDYAAEVSTQETAKAVSPEVETKQVVQTAATSTVLHGSIAGVTFDYAKANAAIATQTMPTVSHVNTQGARRAAKGSGVSPVVKPAMVDTGLPAEENRKHKTIGDGTWNPNLKNKFVVPTYPVSLAIQAVASDLKKTEDLQGFEVRFQDDLNETLEDYGSGEVRLETIMAQPKMTRSIAVIKRGFTPTSTEIILEASNSSDAGVSIPLIDSETFNEIQKPFEKREGSVGALLVELDDESELAKIDVPFGDVIKLDGDLKRTESVGFRYQLFVGVQAGNGMLSYHRGNGEVVSKIVHIHENEITYDANFYEDVVNEKVRLYEEDLLGRESSPLIISGDQVKVFATDKTARKVNNHTYKLNFGASHLGGRRYIELNHQSEPVFVGLRENINVTVPSENFMRFILSNIEGQKLGNRCLVQVNLTKKAEKFEVAAESVGASLMTYSQVLDKDGKFYDTLSEKTQKIIIVGESQASEFVSPDSKINVKVQYADGSVQYLNSYCSPNTYLVEQL